MMTKEQLQRLGIIAVSFGLIASPLAFAAHHEESPAAEATGSAADPMEQGDLAAEADEQGMLEDDEMPAAEATGSAANPASGGDAAAEGGGMLEDDEMPAAKATDSAANPEDG